MIKALVFSKDRALQLQATLESLFLHCADVDSIQISVLYTCSSAQYTRQYLQLVGKWKNKQNLTFVPQNKFRRDVLNILIPYPAKSILRKVLRIFSGLGYRFLRLLSFLPMNDVQGSYILFLVDDALFISDFRIADLIDDLHTNLDVLGFSLRLGRNTTHCYTRNVEQRLPAFMTSSNGALKYKWKDGDLDFGYPLEVSSSLYRIGEIFFLANMVPFNNPNEMEGNMAAHVLDFANKRPFLLCQKRSLAFCNPVNVVQNVSANRTGEVVSHSSTQLAKLFDQGYRIKVDAYNNFTPVSCHQEVSLNLKKVELRKNG